MADFLTNDSYNLFPGQVSSLNCSEFYYKNSEGRKGSQTGFTFTARRAAFTSNMKGGLIQFASNEDGKQYSFSAMILDVLDSKTLTLSVSQTISDTDYIIWYGGIQFDQSGYLSVEGLLANGNNITNALSTIDVQILTSLSLATYTPTAGAKYMMVEGVGAGGAGAGANNTDLYGAGGGGGAGGYFKYIGVAESFTYRCGTGGAAVIGPGNGSPGTNTTIINGIIIPPITASGGNGGYYTPTGLLTKGGEGGLCVGTAIELIGQSGFAGINMADGSTHSALGGRGADTLFGTGGAQTIAGPTTVTNGSNAAGYGSGGSGSARAGVDGSTAVSGTGANGVIYVTEFI